MFACFVEIVRFYYISSQALQALCYDLISSLLQVASYCKPDVNATDK